MTVHDQIDPVPGRLTVLAADDNAANRLMLKSALHLFGVSATVMSNGLEAVEAWRPGAFDVILLDLEMPKMDGPQALAAIRELERGHGLAHAPAIAFSGHDAAQAGSFALGFALHLTKPAALMKLREVVEAAAALRPAAAPEVQPRRQVV